MEKKIYMIGAGLLAAETIMAKKQIEKQGLEVEVIDDISADSKVFVEAYKFSARHETPIEYLPGKFNKSRKQNNRKGHKRKKARNGKNK